MTINFHLRNLTLSTSNVSSSSIRKSARLSECSLSLFIQEYENELQPSGEECHILESIDLEMTPEVKSRNEITLIKTLLPALGEF